MTNLERYLSEVQARCDAAKGDEDFMALLEFNSRSQQDVAVLLEIVKGLMQEKELSMRREFECTGHPEHARIASIELNISNSKYEALIPNKAVSDE